MKYSLYDYKTGEFIRWASRQEWEDSCTASLKDGGPGVIAINGRSVYVIESFNP